MFASVSAELLPPALVLGMSATLHVTAAQVGLLVSVWAITIIVGTVPLVRMTARVPRRPLLVCSFIVFAVMDVVVTLTPLYSVVVAARVVSALAAGVSSAVVFEYVPTLVSPDRLARAMSVVLGGGTLASVLGVPLGAFFAAAGNWQAAFIGSSLVLVAAAGMAACKLPSRPGGGGRRGRRSRADRTVGPVVALLSAGAVLLTGYMCAYAYIVPILVDGAGLPVASISGVLFLSGLAGAAALIGGGIVGDRRPQATLLSLVGIVPLGISLIAWSVTTTVHPGVPIAGTALVGFGIGGVPPLFQARVMRVASPAFRDAAASLFVVILNVGIAAGSTIGALVFPAGVAAVTLTAALTAWAALILFAVTAVTIRERPEVVQGP